MKQRLWQTISGIFTKHDLHTRDQESSVALKAEREWCSAIASLEQLLSEQTDTTQAETQGLILSAPSPILSHTDLLPHYQVGVFTPEFQGLMPFRLPAANATPTSLPPVAEYPIAKDDPLAEEQFCLAFTPHFGIVIVLGKDDQDQAVFQFSFDPQAIQTAWGRLRSRLTLSHPQHLNQLDQLVQTFTPQAPDYRLVTQFSHLLLKNLPQSATPTPRETGSPQTSSPTKNQTQSPEVELLKAFTHEIRTPLTTIRMIARSLLKRKDLPSNVIKRLEVIDQECNEQINRMELIFKAAELKTTPPQQCLTAVSLEQVFQQSIPCWKKQAQRRNVELDIIVPEKLPMVVSDPAMLKQMLTGLMEKFTRSLSMGGQIRIQVTTAGNQLKLQVLSRCPHTQTSPFTLDLSPKTKSIGQLLLFQPETGSISLNLDVTKNLFQALGGKLIVRQHPQEGEIFTIFLPLDATAEANWQTVECHS